MDCYNDTKYMAASKAGVNPVKKMHHACDGSDGTSQEITVDLPKQLVKRY
jgi:hypothetical protein